MAPANVFVVGLDPFSLERLRASRDPDQWRFHELLEFEEVKRRARYPIEALLERARARLHAFPGPLDAIVGYWDFPVSSMVPILCEEFGLPTPGLAAVTRCEHKYWARCLQREAAPEAVPRFAAFDPFDDAGCETLGLEFPFWVKPIKSFASHLAFRVHSEADWGRAVAALREGIGRLADPYDHVLARVELPPELGGVDGHWCVAEEALHGRQCTLEGFACGGEVRVYGTVDSIREPNRSSFARYQYPSRLPRRVQRRMEEVVRRVIGHVGLRGSAFNAEFFWDPVADRVALLEVNPRASQSHADLFEKVDGAPNLQVMVELALGKVPDPPRGGGSFGYAAKFFLRAHRDAVVTEVPAPGVLAALEERIPGLAVVIAVRPGQRLSELPDQDSYSYELATVFLGAESPGELRRLFRRVRRELRIGLRRPAAGAGGARSAEAG